MNIKQLFARKFTDAEIEEKLVVRIPELIKDLESKGIITINDGFVVRVAVDQQQGILKVHHSNEASAVDNLLYDLGVTTSTCEERTIKVKK